MEGRRTEVMLIGGFLVLVVIVAVIAAFMSKGQVNTGVSDSTAAAITATDWVRGNKEAAVSVIEYGDFQCPACGAVAPMVKQLEEEYGDRVQFIFRHFPLYSVHPNAEIASQAAQAAGVQGKFWEMHDLLYAKQSEWSGAAKGEIVTKYFAAYASSLGLNLEQFNADIASDAVIDAVSRDVASGNAARVDHTPTFFINLKEVQNPANYAEFKALIDGALATPQAQ